MNHHDLIVSLGPNCRNTWNLRAHFGVDRAYPFDWWILPAKSLLRLLDPELCFLVIKEDLVVVETGPARNTVYNRRYNLLHHHDFDRVDGRVVEITDQAISNVNKKYQYLFERFWTDLDRSKQPLFIVNGLSSGWQKETPDGGRNAILNGVVHPQEFVSEVRGKLGQKAHVLIIDVGESVETPLDGGLYLRVPDRGDREGLSPKERYAEPVHSFRDAYRLAGKVFSPVGAKESHDEASLRISNNTPRVHFGVVKP